MSYSRSCSLTHILFTIFILIYFLWICILFTHFDNLILIKFFCQKLKFLDITRFIIGFLFTCFIIDIYFIGSEKWRGCSERRLMIIFFKSIFAYFKFIVDECRCEKERGGKLSKFIFGLMQNGDGLWFVGFFDDHRHYILQSKINIIYY